METPKDYKQKISEILRSCNDTTFVRDYAGGSDMYVAVEEATDKIAKWIEGMGIMNPKKQEKR